MKEAIKEEDYEEEPVAPAVVEIPRAPSPPAPATPPSPPSPAVSDEPGPLTDPGSTLFVNLLEPYLTYDCELR